MPHTVPYSANRLFEWCSSAIMVQCGVLAVMSDVLLDAPPQLTFTAFINLGLTLATTGLLFFATGATRCFALYRNGRWKNGPVVRAVCALVGAAIWSQLMFGVLVIWYTHHQLYLSISVWSTMLVFEGLSFSRAMLDSKASRVKLDTDREPALLGIGNEP